MLKNKTSMSRSDAIRCLADDLYVLQRNAELANFCSGDLITDFFDEDCPDGSRKFTDRLLLGYLRARAQANIAHDYICNIQEYLTEFNRISEEDVQPQGDTYEQSQIASSKALAAAVAAADDPTLAHAIEQLAFKLTPDERSEVSAIIDEMSMRRASQAAGKDSSEVAACLDGVDG